MISTATAAVNAAAGACPAASHAVRVASAITMTTGTNTEETRFGEPLYRRLAVLRVLDEPGDPGELGVRADPDSADHQAAGGVHGTRP